MVADDVTVAEPVTVTCTSDAVPAIVPGADTEAVAGASRVPAGISREDVAGNV